MRLHAPPRSDCARGAPAPLAEKMAMPETSMAAASHSRSVKRCPRITMEPAITGSSFALFRIDCVGKSMYVSAVFESVVVVTYRAAEAAIMATRRREGRGCLLPPPRGAYAAAATA